METTLSAKFYKTPSFKELQTRWDEILLEAGFKDHERTKNNDRVLKQYSFNVYRKFDQETKDAREQYFDQLNYFINDTLFSDPKEQTMMTMFSDGKSIKQIVITLTEQGFPIHRQTVRYIIRRWEHVWGIRAWSLRDRNLKHE